MAKIVLENVISLFGLVWF